MALGYRTVLRLEPNVDAVDVAEEHLRRWLYEKKDDRRSKVEIADWEGPGVHGLGSDVELHVVHDEYDGRDARRRLYRMVESNPTGQYAVSIFAAALPRLEGGAQTLAIEVERYGVSRETALDTVAPPRIVRLLLDAVTARDGSTLVTGTPTVIVPGSTKIVLEAISDPDRLSSVVVAGSFSADVDEHWAEVVKSLTQQSVGVAAAFVVTADALPELEASLPDDFRVGAGRVRTYLPKVDLGEPSDAVRHKWLGPATLSRSLDGRRVASSLQRRHAEVARRRFVEADPPADVRRTLGLLKRAESAADREARVADLVSQSTSPSEPTTGYPEPTTEVADAVRTSLWFERVAVTLKRWLGVVDPAPEDLDRLDRLLSEKTAETKIFEEQLVEAAARADELEQELAKTRGRADDLEIDLALAEQDEVERHRELTVLRHRLAQSATPDTFVEADDAVWNAPDTVEELVRRLTPGPDAHPALAWVAFTGNADGALEIDRRYPSGLYARTLWQYIRVLHDYAVAKDRWGFSGNVHTYLSDDRVKGAKCPPTRHAATESETVLANPDWRAERVFPVPASVHPAGAALMEAHFKPTHKDTFAPRMHYLDDTAHSGKICVGYVGRHLTNTRT